MSRVTFSPLRSRRRFPLTRLLALPLAVALFTSPASTQPPSGGSRPDARETPATDRAAIRAEAELARSLARFDEDLELESYPDVSPLWPARMAAAIEAREPDAPGQDLLLRLAAELRTLGAAVPFGAPEDDRRNDLPAFWQPHPSIGAPAGRERAQRIVRIRELVELVDRKLGLSEGPGPLSSPVRTGTPGIGRRSHIAYASDDCASAPDIGIGYFEGETSYNTTDGSSSCDGPAPSPDVWYRFTAPEDGTYTFRTLEPYRYAYDTLLSLHSACPTAGDDAELACSDDSGGSLFSSISRTFAQGEQALVRVGGYGGASGDYRLAIEIGRTIRGTVTREGTGVGLPGVTIEIVDYYDNVLATAVSDSDGDYAVEMAGTSASLYARARVDGSLTEYYLEQDCTFGVSCSRYYATVLDIETADLSGIDFTLEPAGAVSGSVRSSEDGEPVRAYAYLYRADGTLVGSVLQETGMDSFTMPTVPPGVYHVRAAAAGHQSELWNDVPCPSPCDPTTGQSISVVADSTVTGIDFVLDTLGAIEGMVTNAESGDPIPSVYLALYDSSGSYPRSTYSTSDGSYRFFALQPEEHFVRTSSYRYFDELYDGIACEPSCDATTGTPVLPRIGETISGIDFSLTERATISGIVTESATSDPAATRIELYDAAGQYYSGYTSSSTTGEYTFSGLEAGTYHLLAAQQSYYYGSTYEPQLYQNRLCPLDCDVTTGTPVTVTSTSDVNGVDFQLSRRGWISGRITDFVTGDGLSDDWDIWVSAYDVNGDPRGSYSYVGPDGQYELRNLVSGDYRVRANVDRYDNHRSEMWNDVPCESPCDLTTGQIVTVRPDRETAGIDFALNQYGSLSGTVYDGSSDSGAKIDADVFLLDAAGQELASTSHYYSFTLGRIPPGTYYLLARGDEYEDDFQDEVYPDVPCDPDCDVTLGTPITVALDTVHTGLAFYLTRCPAPSFGEVVSTTVDGYLKILACQTIRAEDATVNTTGDLLLRAGEGVVFGDGFSVETGGSLRVVIEPDWADD